MKKLYKTNDVNERIDNLLYRFRSRMMSYPPGMCPLALVKSLFQISMNQSCGKCVPCRDGLVQVERLLEDILAGRGTVETLSEMEKKCRRIAATADCAVGVVSANLVLDSLVEFADEYESHIKDKKCVGDASQTIPCVTLCPAHVDVPGYIACIKNERYTDAVDVIREKNPFPTSCSMICEHPCEKKCRRLLIDDAINIRALKKFAVESAGDEAVSEKADVISTGKQIAVIGGGPSGMTAAYFCTLMGHAVTVFDEHEKLGGMLRYGIPEYRLPKEDLNKDIDFILNSGDITVHTSTRVGRDISFEEIKEKYDAVYIGLGAQIGNRMPVDGADAKNVIPAADFLQMVARGEAPDVKGKHVVLIGGGNVAMDAARTIARLQAETIHVFTRKRDDITALETEVTAAMQEGVRFRTLLSFLNIETDSETGEVSAVWLQPEIIAEYDKNGMMTTEHSEKYPYRFTCDLLILGVGQRADVAEFEKASVPVDRGRIIADEMCRVKGMDGVFAGGDCVSGPSTAIRAIAAGQVAAVNIDEYLGYHHKPVKRVEIPQATPNPCVPTGRLEIEERDPFERRKDFSFVEVEMTKEEAMREAGRCLRCDYYGCGVMEGGRGDE